MSSFQPPQKRMSTWDPRVSSFGTKQSVPPPRSLKKTRVRLRCPCRQLRCDCNIALRDEDGLAQNKTTSHRGESRHGSLVSQRSTPGGHSGPLIHAPTCDENAIRKNIVWVLDNLKIDHSWHAFVPSYVGSSSSVDAACKSFIYATNFRATENTRYLELAERHYANTVGILRQQITPDDSTLLTVALLMLQQHILGSGVATCVTHQKGIGAIILSQAKAGSVSELARAIFFTCWTVTFSVPVLNGVLSPYDCTEVLELEPSYQQSGIDDEVRILRKKCHQLCIRLPRLITQLRRFCQSSASPQDLAEAFKLATELSDLEDRSAESDLLHKVKIVPTTSKSGVALSPYSFEFQHRAQYEAAMLYWTIRIVANQAYIKLIYLICYVNPDVPGGDSTISETHKSTFDYLQDEQQRLCMNIMMSWQYEPLRNLQKCNNPAMPAFKVAWAAVSRLRHYNLRGKPVSQLREELLAHIKDELPYPLDMAKQDEAVKYLLDGGPADGFFGIPQAAMSSPTVSTEHVSQFIWRPPLAQSTCWNLVKQLPKHSDLDSLD